jgi:hypothetical protein
VRRRILINTWLLHTHTYIRIEFNWCFKRATHCHCQEFGQFLARAPSNDHPWSEAEVPQLNCKLDIFTDHLLPVDRSISGIQQRGDLPQSDLMTSAVTVEEINIDLLIDLKSTSP